MSLSIQLGTKLSSDAAKKTVEQLYSKVAQRWDKRATRRNLLAVHGREVAEESAASLLQELGSIHHRGQYVGRFVLP